MNVEILLRVDYRTIDGQAVIELLAGKPVKFSIEAKHDRSPPELMFRSARYVGLLEIIKFTNEVRI